LPPCVEKNTRPLQLSGGGNDLTTAFIKSPIFDNWFREQQPEESIIICSPYFKNEAIEKLIRLYNLSNIDNKIELRVLIRGQLGDFLQGSTDIAALESLLQLKSVDVDNVRRVTNLHMKAYLIDGKSLLIGSGNFTRNGILAGGRSGNVEGGIATTDSNIISDFLAYFEEINSISESLDTFYDNIVDGYQRYVDKYSDNIGGEISALITKGESKVKYYVPMSTSTPSQITSSENKMLSELIPQFSNFDDGAYTVVNILMESDNKGLTFLQLGKKLLATGKTNYAYNKYGENHSKLAELLDLVTINQERPRKILLTELGKSFYHLKKQQKEKILKNQVYRMEIVKDIIVKHSEDTFNLIEYLMANNLSLSTAKRRAPNVRKLFQFLKSQGLDEVDSIIERI
jgi:hypothetical protein